MRTTDSTTGRLAPDGVGRLTLPDPSRPAGAGGAAVRPEGAPARSAQGRLLSLDAFRGLTIAAMILVNAPGSRTESYPQLMHVAWNGWTVAETIAPAFLWIVGVALALSTPVVDGVERHRPLRVVVRRAAALFALGVLISATPAVVPLLDFSALATLRLPGTLQRIALCYLAAAVIHRRFGARGVATWVVVLLAGYWLLMTLVPVPGHGAGVLEPERNLAAWVDQVVLGPHAKAQDPLGILGTLPSVATTLLGVLAGLYLRGGDPGPVKTAWLFTAGNLLIVAGVVAAWWIPVNQGLWTPSYAILMAGIATSAFAFCHWLVDVRGHRRLATPFATFGLNGLVLFVLSQMLMYTMLGVGLPAFGREWVSLQGILFEGVFEPLGSTRFASLLHALAWVAAFFALAQLMYRKRWIIKV